MDTTQENNKRIAKNTLMLYSRQIIIMLVSLYTVRVTLQVLGAEDFGLYDVVAGVVTAFSFISGTLTSATQRFFSFELGKKDPATRKLEVVFSVNMVIYIGIAVLLLILLETVGLWFIQERLSIPEGREQAVLIIYHFAVISFFFTVIRTPYNAIIIAHEDMHLFAVISIVEALLKLFVVFLLKYLSTADSLIFYASLTAIVSIVVAVIYIIVSHKKYAECQYKKIYWDKATATHLANFTGWTLFGQMTTVLRNQAVTISVNQFFSPVVIAAQSIAKNIAGTVNSFATNFNTSLYPPIIKYYAAGEKKQLYSLVINGSRITFFLLWVLALPLIVEMEFVLSIWLTELPPGVILFSQLALIEALIQSISLPLITAARAPGKMKLYELSLGTIQILIFMFTVIAFSLGAEPYSMYIVAIIANIVLFFVRLYIVQGLIGIQAKSFIAKALIPSIGVVVLSSFLTMATKHLIQEGLFTSISIIILSMLYSCIAMYLIGLSRADRERVKSFLRDKFSIK